MAKGANGVKHMGHAILRCRAFPACGDRSQGSIPTPSNLRAIGKMATFNKVFSTQRLVQIIVVLGVTVIMKLLS
jgi:hypothetical protein